MVPEDSSDPWESYSLSHNVSSELRIHHSQTKKTAPESTSPKSNPSLQSVAADRYRGDSSWRNYRQRRKSTGHAVSGPKTSHGAISSGGNSRGRSNSSSSSVIGASDSRCNASIVDTEPSQRRSWTPMTSSSEMHQHQVRVGAQNEPGLCNSEVADYVTGQTTLRFIRQLDELAAGSGWGNNDSRANYVRGTGSGPLSASGFLLSPDLSCRPGCHSSGSFGHDSENGHPEAVSEVWMEYRLSPKRGEPIGSMTSTFPEGGVEAYSLGMRAPLQARRSSCDSYEYDELEAARMRIKKAAWEVVDAQQKIEKMEHEQQAASMAGLPAIRVGHYGLPAFHVSEADSTGRFNRGRKLWGLKKWFSPMTSTKS